MQNKMQKKAQSISNRRYCVIIVYSPSLGRDKIDFEIEKFKTLVNEHQGHVEKAEYMGIKPLAYTIKQHDTAHYVQMYVNLEFNNNLSKNLSEINRKITLNIGIIRHMIIKIEHKDFNFQTLRNYEGFENNLKV